MRGFAARGKTVLFATHYLEEALALCKTLAVIDLGVIIACGSKQDVVAAAHGDLTNYFLKERRAELLKAGS